MNRRNRAKKKVVEGIRKVAEVFADGFAGIYLDRLKQREFHPHTLLLREAQQEAADYVRERMPQALAFATGHELLAYAAQKAEGEGLVCEFGVAEGASIRVLAEALRGPIFGFDSFEGLPEDWSGRHEPAGAYSTGGRLPEVPPQVELLKGWFEDSIPPFLLSHRGPARLLHIDCDLYSSTRTVLEAFADRVRPGTVIVFDEYFNYVTWREHEHRAFREVVAERGWSYRYLGYAYQQVAVRITATESPEAEG